MPKHLLHLAEGKSPIEVSRARENFQSLKKKMRKLKEAREILWWMLLMWHHKKICKESVHRVTTRIEWI
ncbi:hypothetical protein ACHAW6_000216 [Cyclotella cf. meneghiniana]